MDIKKLFELAGVDVTKGKAKVLCEQEQTWKYTEVDNYTGKPLVSFNFTWDGVDMLWGLHSVFDELIRHQSDLDEGERDDWVNRMGKILHKYGSRGSDRDNPRFAGAQGGYVYSDETSIILAPM